MTTAFQDNAFQVDAFQIDQVTVVSEDRPSGAARSRKRKKLRYYSDEIPIAEPIRPSDYTSVHIPIEEEENEDDLILTLLSRVIH